MKKVPKKVEPDLILVGFGKHSLKDMLEWIDTDKEEDLLKAFRKWPGVYRRLDSCAEVDIKAYCQYMAYLQDALLEYELNTPQGDKEITNE